MGEEQGKKEHEEDKLSERRRKEKKREKGKKEKKWRPNHSNQVVGAGVSRTTSVDDH